LDDGVAASFQRSRIHKPHAHTHAFKVNRSTSRSLILNFPTIKEPQIMSCGHVYVIRLKDDVEDFKHSVAHGLKGNFLGYILYQPDPGFLRLPSMGVLPCSAVIQASKPTIPRNQVDRNRYGAQYDTTTFRMRLRMSRTLFTCIVQDIIDHYLYFQLRYDCTRKVGISALMKCTSAIRQMVYDTVTDALDEYPTYTDMKKLYAHHEEKHGFPGMIGIIDCTDYPWKNRPIAFRAQIYRGDHGPNPFILLEPLASQYLWIWHAFFGVSGMNNDVNVVRKSPIFNDLKSWKAPDVPFVANEVTYKREYYFTDGKYPEWFVLIKSISNPGSNDHKRIMYKTAHEAAHKDVERDFSVLKRK
ncbi:ALP1-like protein, partial [Tanacetum coccineum]